MNAIISKQIRHEDEGKDNPIYVSFSKIMFLLRSFGFGVLLKAFNCAGFDDASLNCSS
jgi:hypothetical protein